MNIQVRHAPEGLAILAVSLSDVIALPDPEAAVALDARMGVFEQVQRLHERGFAERTIIVREFETRSLWKHLTDPDTGETFPHLTAWLSCSSFLGCRRVNFEALRTGKLLADVPSYKLIDIPKSTLHTLSQLSTQVRNEPDVLEAARTMKPDEFLEKIEAERPQQHIEARAPMRLTPGRSERKIIERWLAFALAHDIAGSLTEAVVKACERCLLDEELNELHPVPDEVIP
jgi:hypothetical protein